MVPCISALCVVGVVGLALLIMTRAVSLEQAFKTFGQAFVVVVIALWAICVLKGLVAVAVSALKSLAAWIAIIAFAIIGLAVLLLIVSKAWMRLQRDSVKRERDHA
jgi:hypothetical protein